MLLSNLLLGAWFAVAGTPPARDGVIVGTVVNASRGKAPVAGSEVMLGIRLAGEFVPYDQTKTDALGRFRFQRLPVGSSYTYRAGANRDGVHYPGPSLELAAQRPSASVELAVYDAVADPSPLVVRRHAIALRYEPGALSATESLLIENPTSTCYVGRAGEDGGEPVTLQLAIPPEFTRVTFDQEFYGRRFAIAGGKLVTGIPWPPGKREVKFTYVVPTQSGYHRWQRPLDLPCDLVRVRVENAGPEDVACNLKPGTDQETGARTFDSDGKTLSAGHTISVELGRLPVPLMAYARWAALAILTIFVAGASLMLIRRRRGDKAAATIPESRTSATGVAPAPSARDKPARQKPNPSSSRRAA